MFICGSYVDNVKDVLTDLVNVFYIFLVNKHFSKSVDFETFGTHLKLVCLHEIAEIFEKFFEIAAILQNLSNNRP